MHYFNKNIKDWAHATSHLSPEEEGIYNRLVDYYYDQEKAIPLKTQPVFRRLRLGSHTKTAQEILEEFFHKEEDGWHHTRCDIEIAAYQAKAEQSRKNGKKGGRPPKDAGSSETQPVKQKNPGGLQKETEGFSKRTLTTNHKPLTTNQETKSNTTTTDPPGAEIIHRDFCPNVHTVQAIVGECIPLEFIDQYLPRFVAYWIAEQQRKVSWDSVFLEQIQHRWKIEAKEFLKQGVAA